MALPSCATQPISRVRAARPHCAIVLHANSRWSDRTVAISLVPRRAPIRRAGKLAVMWRGGCSFVDKVRRAQSAGAVRDGPARSARLAWRCSRPLVLATSSRMASADCFGRAPGGGGRRAGRWAEVALHNVGHGQRGRRPCPAVSHDLRLGRRPAPRTAQRAVDSQRMVRSCASTRPSHQLCSTCCLRRPRALAPSRLLL